MPDLVYLCYWWHETDDEKIVPDHLISLFFSVSKFLFDWIFLCWNDVSYITRFVDSFVDWASELRMWISTRQTCPIFSAKAKQLILWLTLVLSFCYPRCRADNPMPDGHSIRSTYEHGPSDQLISAHIWLRASATGHHQASVLKAKIHIAEDVRGVPKWKHRKKVVWAEVCRMIWLLALYPLKVVRDWTVNLQTPRAAMTVLYCVLCTYGCTMEPAHVEEHYVQQRVQILSTAVGSYGDCCTDNR